MLNRLIKNNSRPTIDLQIAQPRSGSLASLPFNNHLAHVFWRVISYPGHKASVETKARSALFKHKTPHILGVFIACADGGVSCDFVAVPVKRHLPSCNREPDLGRGSHALSALQHLIQRLFQGVYRALDIVQLLQPEQADAEGLEVRRLVALQGDAGGDLQALGGEFFAGFDFAVVGVADHHAGGLEAFGGDAFKAFAGEQGADLFAESPLFVAYFGEAVAGGFLDHVAKAGEGVAGHGGVVGVAALFVGLHDLQPFLQVAGEAGALAAFDALAGLFAEHHQGAAGRGAPAFLRSADQYVDAIGAHVDPERAGGDAVEHEQAADRVHGVGDGAQVVVGQDHSRGGFDMGGENHLWLLRLDGRYHFVYRWRGEGGLAAGFYRPGLQDLGFGGDLAHLEDLRPAVAEPAVADHQAFFAGGQLPRHGFHAEGAAARHHGYGAGVVHLLQVAGDVAHDLLKGLRHVVEGAVGVDDRIFDQAIGIDTGVEV